MRKDIKLCNKHREKEKKYIPRNFFYQLYKECGVEECHYHYYRRLKCTRRKRKSK